MRIGILEEGGKYGDKYYEDNKQFFGCYRWVIYIFDRNDRNIFWDVDGSMVFYEWYFWFYCMINDFLIVKLFIVYKFIWINYKFNGVVFQNNMQFILLLERRFGSGFYF